MFACICCRYAHMGNAAKSTVHCAIHGISPEVDRGIRPKVAQQKKNLNRVVVDELTRALIGGPQTNRLLRSRRRMDARFRFRRRNRLGACHRSGKMEIKIALDTNRLTDLFRRDASLATQSGRKTVAILFATRETTEQNELLFVQLKRAGTAISGNDPWIAAIALENDLPLIRRDGHFRNLSPATRDCVTSSAAYSAK